MKEDRVGAEGEGRADSGRECRGKKGAEPWVGEGRGEGALWRRNSAVMALPGTTPLVPGYV